MFKDINLKLAIISCLTEKGLFIEEANDLKMKAIDKRSFQNLDYDDVIPDVYDFYKNIKIKDELARITKFNPSASNICYNLIVKEWSGEDDIFDIQSLEGIENLNEMELFAPFGLLDYNIDISALLKCNKLETVNTEFIPKTLSTRGVLEKLNKRGVRVI